MSTKAIMDEQKDKGLALRDRGYGHIRDYKSGQATVVWNDLPDEARRGGLFKLKKGKVEMVLSKHDLQYLLRNV